MMRSMYSGVSGLKNHQTRMDVIGNNIANINTNGYKKSRVVFKDTLYQKLRGATSPVEGGRGGTNPMAIGLGMGVSSVDQIHTATAVTSTNKLTDMAIDGNGYFVLKNGKQTYFTRAGNFDFDKMGMLTNVSNGYNVQGWMANKDQTDASGDWPITIVPATTETINISSYKECKPRATTESTFAGNLDSTSVFNEIQLLSFAAPNQTGGAVGGQFRLSFKGQDTAWISVGANPTATAASMQIALENLGTIGTGNVAVSYNATAANPRYEIKFQKDLASIDVPSVTFTAGPAAAFNGTLNAAQTNAYAAAVSAVDEVDTITFTDTTGGTFDLTVGAYGTANIDFLLDSAPDIQNEIIALDAALTGKVTVDGNSGAGFVITIDSSLGDVNLTADFTNLTGGPAVAGDLAENTAGVTAVAAIAEEQTVTLTGATAGSYTLSYNGVVTDPIPHNASADTVRIALQAIPALSSVTVAGADGGPYIITFPTSMGDALDLQATAISTGFTATANPVATFDPIDPGFNPEDTDCLITSQDVYDNHGNNHTVYFRFFKYAIEPGPPTISKWACDVSLDSRFENAPGYSSAATDGYDTINISSLTDTESSLEVGEKQIRRLYNIQFDTKGKITGASPFTLTVGNIPPIEYAGSSLGTDDVVYEIDFSALTQYNSDDTAKATYQDGYAFGVMTGYTVGIDGTIRGAYSNGETRSLAKIALANFENPAGMIQAGGTLFQESANSGTAAINGATIGGLGSIAPSSLEMSNVDLSEEFTDMIVTQRGFQANSRIITTSDEMIQELVNLKR